MTSKDEKPDFIIINGNLSINVNEIKEIILKESQLENQAAADFNWNKKYILLKDLIRLQDIDRRHHQKTKVKDKTRILDSFAMLRKHNAPLSNSTGQTIEEPTKENLDGRFLDKTKLVDKLDTFFMVRRHNAPLSKKNGRSTKKRTKDKHEGHLLDKTKLRDNLDTFFMVRQHKTPLSKETGQSIKEPTKEKHEGHLLDKTEPRDNLDTVFMVRQHKAPLSKETGQSIKEPTKDKHEGHLLDKSEPRDNLDTVFMDIQHNAPLSNKTDNSTEEPKNNNGVFISSQELANYEPLILSIFTTAPANYSDVGLHNVSINDESSLVSRPEPVNYETLVVTKHEPGNNKPLQETNNEPIHLSHADSERKLVSSQEIPQKDMPKYALFVNYDLLNSSNNIEPHSNENTAIKTPAPKRYEPDPFTYEPVKNRHRIQPESVSHFDPPILNDKPNLVSNHEPDTYEPVKNRHRIQPESVSHFDPPILNDKPNLVPNYEPDPYEPVKNPHQFQSEIVPHLKPASIPADKSIVYQHYGPVLSDNYLPLLVSSITIAPHQTVHRITNTETKQYLNNKPTSNSNADLPRVQNYESATYYHNKPEIIANPEPKISNYNSAIFEPQQSNFEPDNLQPANYDAPNYNPVNYELQLYEPRNDEPRNYEPQNYETSQFSKKEPQTYERFPSKQLVYNYSHQSHLDNLRNEGEVEILDVIYDDDEHEAQIIEAMNQQTLVMEKLANVIQNENRRKMKLSRGEKHFNELLDEIADWNNKTSTTPKQKLQSKNATKVTPSIITMVDETEIRKALKENPLVKRILKMAARKRKEYLDAAKKYYNITT